MVIYVYIVLRVRYPVLSLHQCFFIFVDSGAVVGTCSAVAELFPGDQVRVTGDDEFPGTARGDGFSGVTGYMISRLD